MQIYDVGLAATFTFNNKLVRAYLHNTMYITLCVLKVPYTGMVKHKTIIVFTGRIFIRTAGTRFDEAYRVQLTRPVKLLLQA